MTILKLSSLNFQPAPPRLAAGSREIDIVMRMGFQQLGEMRPFLIGQLTAGDSGDGFFQRTLPSNPLAAG